MNIIDLLRSVKDGKITVEMAAKSLRLQSLKEVEDACLDISRETRKDVPEIILAEGKSIESLAKIAQVLYEENGRVIITRIDSSQSKSLERLFKGKAEVIRNEKARAMVIKKRGFAQQMLGKVAILTAGTSDVRTAEEAKIVLGEMGCQALTFYDVGIAGIHRLFPALKRSLKEDVDCFIVIAGMEGALPSIVSGLVSVPVIGVPSSSGYGAGGRGEGALIAMLQSCSPGLVVVNIDNGVGAAVAAILLSKKIHCHS